mgnify:CR=1 FL=1|tara:strand:- start:6093 stop:6248 length:156 start_codon:yes stop_codon:yes gene_type:complete
MIKLTENDEIAQCRKIISEQYNQIELLKKHLADETREKYGYIKRIKELLNG